MQGRKSVIPDSEEVSYAKERRKSIGKKISVVCLLAIIIIAAFLLIRQIGNSRSCPEGHERINGECVVETSPPATNAPDITDMPDSESDSEADEASEETVAAFPDSA